MQRARYSGDLLEIAENLFVPVDVSFENFPVVDARLPRRSGVGENEAGIDLVGSDGNGLAMDAVGLQMNCADSAIKSRIVILTSGGNADELRLNILRDHADLFQSDFASSEAGEGGSGCDHE